MRAACGAVPAEALDGTVFIGELTLSGGLRPVAGALPMVIAASARGMLGKTSEVAAAAEQSAVAMREAAQTAAGLIRAARSGPRKTSR